MAAYYIINVYKKAIGFVGLGPQDLIKLRQFLGLQGNGI